MISRRLALLGALVLCLPVLGCDALLTDPGTSEAPTVEVALSFPEQGQGGLGQAFALVDQARVRLERSGGGPPVAEVTVPFVPLDGMAVIVVSLPPDASSTVEGVAVTLSRQGAPLFAGRAPLTLQPGRAFQDVDVTVSPVAATVEITSLPVLDALGASGQAQAEARMATGQAIPGAEVTWSSLDPGVATVTPSGVVTAVAEGEARLVARAGSGDNEVASTATLEIRATVVEVVVEPGSVVLAVESEAVVTALALDRNGNALARTATWSSDDEEVAGITPEGSSAARIEGRRIGTTLVRASVEGAEGTATVRVEEPLVILTSTLPGGLVGVSYSSTLAASGGTGAFEWRLVSGSLPPGLTLSPGGVISGVPTTEGDFVFTVGVRSGAQETTRQFTLATRVDRTSSILVRVTVFSEPAQGIEVNISGPDATSLTTNSDGEALATGLRIGQYLVTIDPGPFAPYFSSTSQTLTITKPGTAAVVTFEGNIGSPPASSGGR